MSRHRALCMEGRVMLTTGRDSVSAPPCQRPVVLVFPPITEARFFPYLSLPMLAAYLRRHGVSVQVSDLNIALCHHLFSAENIRILRDALRVRASDTLHTAYRREVAAYLLEHQAALWASVFAREPAQAVPQPASSFVRQGIELLLEKSQLTTELSSLAALDTLVDSVEAPAAGDLAMQTYRKLTEELLAQGEPGIFGISIPFYSQLLPSLLLARWVRERYPRTRIVFGGQQIMLRHRELAALPVVRRYVDCLGIGPGEQTLLTLCRLATGEAGPEAVPDAVWTHGPHALQPPVCRSSLHIREVPPPDFQGLPIHQYMDSETQLAIITCVGCYWGRCAFCSYGNRSLKDGYQQKSAVQIADECEHLIAEYGVSRINFVDENTNLRLVVQAVRLLERRGLRIRFSTRNRLEATLRDKAFCRQLQQLGCILMSAGYETNSQRLLDLLDKGIAASSYQEIIDNLHEVGIPLRLSIMGGLPGETSDELEASRAFLAKNAAKIGIDIMQMLVCEPQTLLAENPELYQIQLSQGRELRGNRKLNYGQGRMGWHFLYADGDTFDARLDSFLSIYRTVHPQKNDELPPLQRRRTEPARQRGNQLALFPWVRVLKAPLRTGAQPERILADLLWQAFYRLPSGVQEFGRTLRAQPGGGSAAARGLLQQLATAGVGHLEEQEEI